MPTDGIARYDRLSGKELVLTLESLDRSVFPLNYETLLREIESRGPSAAMDVGEREVATFGSLPVLERGVILRACMFKIFVLLLQYSVVGGIAVGIVRALAVAILESSGAVWSVRTIKGIESIALIGLTVASYWAFLKWMLHAKVGHFTFALLRDVGESPNSRLERSHDE